MGFSRALTTSSASCIRSVHLSTGMLAKGWKKANSVRHAKIWPHWKKTTKRLALRPLKAKERRKVTETSSEACRFLESNNFGNSCLFNFLDVVFHVQHKK